MAGRRRRRRPARHQTLIAQGRPPFLPHGTRGSRPERDRRDAVGRRAQPRGVATRRIPGRKPATTRTAKVAPRPTPFGPSAVEVPIRAERGLPRRRSPVPPRRTHPSSPNSPIGQVTSPWARRGFQSAQGAHPDHHDRPLTRPRTTFPKAVSGPVADWQVSGGGSTKLPFS